LPTIVGGQGGPLDVALDPRFAANRLVYWGYTEAAPEGGNRTAVARGRR
jgi:glucose/arabinose dehydrogenase